MNPFATNIYKMGFDLRTKFNTKFRRYRLNSVYRYFRELTLTKKYIKMHVIMENRLAKLPDSYLDKASILTRSVAITENRVLVEHIRRLVAIIKILDYYIMKPLKDLRDFLIRVIKKRKLYWILRKLKEMLFRRINRKK